MRRLLALPLLLSAFASAQEAPKKEPAAKAAAKEPAKDAADKPAKASKPVPGPGGRAEKAESILNVLRSRRLTAKLEKATVDEFIDWFRGSTGINVFVHKGRMTKDGVDPEGIQIDLDVKDVAAADLLKLAFAGMDVGFRIEGNVLIITSKKDARGKPVLRIYGVAHLLVPIRDFPGRDMNVYPSNYEPPEPPEAEVVQTYDSSESLAELVRTFTGEGTWEDEGVRITVFRHQLFIRTYPTVHAEIERLLAELPH